MEEKEGIQKPDIQDAKLVMYMGTLGRIRLWNVILLNGKSYLRIEDLGTKEVENIAYKEQEAETVTGTENIKEEQTKEKSVNELEL